MDSKKVIGFLSAKTKRLSYLESELDGAELSETGKQEADQLIGDFRALLNEIGFQTSTPDWGKDSVDSKLEDLSRIERQLNEFSEAARLRTSRLFKD